MVTSLNLKYAERLRALRLLKDIKQKHAAELLGLPNQQSYSKLENGSRLFTEDMIGRVCAVFELSVDTFKNCPLTQSPNQHRERDKPMNRKIPVEEILTAKDELIESQRNVIQLYEKLLLDKEAIISKLKAAPL